MNVTAYDSVDIATVPADAQFLMGYNSGAWPTYGQMRDRFPKARVLSIAVQADIDGDILDAEPGDATPGEVAEWVHRQFARGAKRPVVYSSVSQFPEILRLLADSGIGREDIRIWTAHYNGVEHLCGPGRCVDADRDGFNTVADATQWTDAALGRNLDQSLCQDEFWNVKTGPAAHYDWYAAKIEVDKHVYDEQTIAEAYDKLRDRPLSRIIPNRPKLKVLRNECEILADRIARVSLYDPDGKKRPRALWGEDHRGFRYAGLLHRSQGKRVA